MQPIPRQNYMYLVSSMNYFFPMSYKIKKELGQNDTDFIARARYSV